MVSLEIKRIDYIASCGGVVPTRMSRVQCGPAGKLPDDAPASGWRTRRDGPGLRTEPAEGRRRAGAALAGAWAGRSGPPRAGAPCVCGGCLQEEGGNKWCQTRTSTRVLRVLLIGSLIPQHTKGWDLLFVMQLGWAPMLSASRHHYITSTALTEALGAIGSVAACLDLSHTHCSAGW